MKCQCCKNEEAVFAWQPFGPDTTPARYTALGSHYRGFPVIKVCTCCKDTFTSGDEVSFVYKQTRYVGKDHKVEEKIYTNWKEAEEAMNRGETVRVEVEPFPIDPHLLQLAQDLQDKEKLEEWKHSCTIEAQEEPHA